MDLDLQQIADMLKRAVVSALKEGATRQECFSIPEAARIVGVSEKHIRRVIKRQDLDCSNVGGSKRPTYRITRKAIDAWLEATRIRKAPARSERDALVNKYFPKS